jgi:hypothetical protein
LSFRKTLENHADANESHAQEEEELTPKDLVRGGQIDTSFRDQD